MVPPKVAISELMGRLKGRSAIRILKSHPKLRKNRYWGNHFWAPGYCVDTIGLDAEMIRRYVRYQEAHEKKIEQQQLKFLTQQDKGTTLRLPSLGAPLKPRPLGGFFYIAWHAELLSSEHFSVLYRD